MESLGNIEAFNLAMRNQGNCNNNDEQQQSISPMDLTLSFQPAVDHVNNQEIFDWTFQPAMDMDNQEDLDGLLGDTVDMNNVYACKIKPRFPVDADTLVEDTHLAYDPQFTTMRGGQGMLKYPCPYMSVALDALMIR
jgi:hypothetical protein